MRKSFSDFGENHFLILKKIVFWFFHDLLKHDLLSSFAYEKIVKKSCVNRVILTRFLTWFIPQCFLFGCPTHQTNLRRDPDRRSPSSGSANNQTSSRCILYLLMHGILITGTHNVTVGETINPICIKLTVVFAPAILTTRLLIWAFISRRISSNKADTFYNS